MPCESHHRIVRRRQDPLAARIVIFTSGPAARRRSTSGLSTARACLAASMFAGRTSCHRFPANQSRLLLSSAAYVLVQALRREAPVGTELAEAPVGTIRLKLLKVAARVAGSVRRLVFHPAGSSPYRALFRRVYHRVMGEPVAPLGSG